MWEGRLIGYKAKNQYFIWDGNKTYIKRDIIFNKIIISPLTKNKKRKTPNGVIIKIISKLSPASTQLTENDINNLFSLINGFQQQNT